MLHLPLSLLLIVVNIVYALIFHGYFTLCHAGSAAIIVCFSLLVTRLLLLLFVTFHYHITLVIITRHTILFTQAP